MIRKKTPVLLTLILSFLFAVSAPVNSFAAVPAETYAKQMQTAIDSLKTSLTLTIGDPDYDYEKIYELVDMSGIKGFTMSGARTDFALTLKYNFEWMDGHAVVAAFRNPALEGSRLTPRQKTVLSACRQITKLIIKEGMTDYEKVLAIHDYIIKRCEQDSETMENRDVSDEIPFTAYGALINKKAVCQGYTEAAYILFSMAGLENYRLESEEHTWNLVKIDDGYYHIDLTWDDPDDGKPSSVIYDYFGLTDAQMGRYADHDWADRAKYPKAEATEYHYYMRNGMYAKSYAEMKQLITESVSAGKKDIRIWVGDHLTREYDWQKDLNFILNLKAGARRVKTFYFSVPDDMCDMLILAIEY